MRYTLLALLVFALPVRADSDKDFFPLKVGTKWTYKIGTGQDKITVTALKQEKVGQQMCTLVEWKLKDQAFSTEHVAVLKDGIYRFKMADKNVEPPLCFLKSAAKKGEPWSQEFKLGDTAAKSKYELSVEDVEVPAGKYENALVILGEAIEKKEETTTRTRVWYAKNTGMVKQVIDSGDATLTLELEKMESPKD
jgi:hypothetical protein